MEVYINPAQSDLKLGMTRLTVMNFVFPRSCKVPRLRVRPSVPSQAGGVGLLLDLCVVAWLNRLTVFRSFLPPPGVH